MGHRALVAYERPDGTYNLHYSHWGACNLKLAHEITAATPFGGENTGAEGPQSVYEQLQTASTYRADGIDMGFESSTSVEPEPRALRVTFDEILEEHLDYLSHEALYLVSETFEITPYRTFWLGFSHQVDD